MASGTASSANPGSGISLTAQPNGAARPTNKSSSSMKASDGGRKQTSSPVDGSQRRAPVPKAWTSAINPITQKSTSLPQQNGNVSQQTPGLAGKAGIPKESGSADKHAHDRLTFILAASTGTLITMLTTSGDKFEGVLTRSALESSQTNITIKMAKKVASASDARVNGDADQSSAFTGSGPDFAMTFNGKDIAEISLPSLSMPEQPKAQNGASARFRTDADISRASERSERPLQPWVPDSAAKTDMSLESASTAGWDQFEANKRLFGTNSTFDEHLYTTQIDRSGPGYKERERQAARLAKEIENSTSSIAHVREERGQAVENDGIDEEDKYSGVRRDDVNFPPLKSGHPDKYMPPARRAPTALPTVAGAPVDPAIISAQISKPETVEATQAKSQSGSITDASRSTTKDISAKRGPSPPINPEPIDRSSNKANTSAVVPQQTSPTLKDNDKTSKAAPTPSSQRKMPENATEDVEKQLLNEFKQFAASEKMRVQQSQRTRATNDRQSKLKELLNFSTTFKLRTPVPSDLVGILAKDPVKQERLVEKARKEHEEKPTPTSATPQSTPSALSKVSSQSSQPKLPKFDASMVPPPIPEPLNRTRQGLTSGRNERGGQPQQGHGGRGVQGFGTHRASGLPHERRQIPPQSIPTPIPIHEGRIAPLGPLGDQSGLSSPHRSSVPTPTSAVSSKFNAKASEFRPNANAPTFTPGGPSGASPSPQPVQSSRSVSGRVSPSSFFGAKKPKPAADRLAMADCFNPFARLKKEAAQQKEMTKKDYSSNGGIIHAYTTPPRWDVADEHQDKTYKDVFDKLFIPRVSPAPSARSMSSHQVPYQPQLPYHMQNGGHMAPGPPQHHVQHPQAQHQPNHFENDHNRVHMGSAPQVFPSPRLGSGQMVYHQQMGHPGGMQYGQPSGQYMPAPVAPSSMHMRPYPGQSQYMNPQTPQMGAPMMTQQASNGPYMGVPQQPYQQMPMYSPNPSQAYPQQGGSQPHSGYPSPSRTAPMMMHQGSQQGQHGGHQFYGMPQGGQMGYGQAPPMRAVYPGQHTPYGTSPGQGYHYPQQQQRTMSSGYGGGYHGKVPMQHMQPNQGPPVMNGMPQQIGYPPQDGPVDMGK